MIFKVYYNDKNKTEGGCKTIGFFSLMFGFLFGFGFNNNINNPKYIEKIEKIVSQKITKRL